MFDSTAKSLKVVSYGGGVNSTAMTIHLIRQGIIPDLVLFTDTGAEMPQTLDYIKYFSNYLMKVVSREIDITQKEGDGLYDFCYRKHLVPMREL
ncbi:MAG: phosphoadenosine phosphosulfate reductase family protein [Nitrospirae bacterium]|nr:phosphoadenosine phosphosulfate reductase family protein [Nitrospirota bacterium]